MVVTFPDSDIDYNGYMANASFEELLRSKKTCIDELLITIVKFISYKYEFGQSCFILQCINRVWVSK